MEDSSVQQTFAALMKINSQPQPKKEVIKMLYWALVFFVVALIAALFGFGGIAGAAAGIARVLFFIFLIVFVVSLILGVVKRPRV